MTTNTAAQADPQPVGATRQLDGAKREIVTNGGAYTEGDQVAGSKIVIESVQGGGTVVTGRGGQAISAQGALQPNIFTAATVNIQAAGQVQEMASRRQAPLPPPEYIGRGEVEANLKQLLLRRTQGHSNWVNLWGLPGSGKTGLARHLAAELELEFPDGTLWADLDELSPELALRNFLAPFAPSLASGGQLSTGQQLAALEQAIGDQRVLIIINRVRSYPQARQLLPSNCRNVAVLLISLSRLPGLVAENNAIYLPEMRPEDAIALFETIWRDSFTAQAPEHVLRGLAEAMNYLPSQIAVVARDIMKNRISPAEYLRRLQQRGEQDQPLAASAHPGFQVVYENLPQQARRLLPFVGVMGAGNWDVNALAAVAQESRAETQAALEQMQEAGFVSMNTDMRWSTPPVVRSFALKQADEARLRLARALLAYDTLQRVESILQRNRQVLFEHAMLDEALRSVFLEALQSRLAITPAPYKDEPAALLPWYGLDVMRDLLEELVLPLEAFGARWGQVLLMLERQGYIQTLLEGLDWAVRQEDWELVRRFARLGCGSFFAGLQIKGEVEKPAALELSSSSFAVLRGIELENLQLTANLKGASCSNLHWMKMEIIQARWWGVHLAAFFSEVDLVGAEMPGLVVADSFWTDVDMRSADLRGALFYGCQLEMVNFRNTNLERAEFINCVGSDLDFRGANMTGIQFLGGSLSGKFDERGIEQIRLLATGTSEPPIKIESQPDMHSRADPSG
jgi:uncharacterized protein YjbI with pentapeptide repeats